MLKHLTAIPGKARTRLNNEDSEEEIEIKNGERTQQALDRLPRLNPNSRVGETTSPAIAFKVARKHSLIIGVVPPHTMYVNPNKSVNRKLRVEKFEPLMIYDLRSREQLNSVCSLYDLLFEYQVGEVATPRGKISLNPEFECTSGIHVYSTPEAAVQFGLGTWGWLRAYMDSNLDKLIKRVPVDL